MLKRRVPIDVSAAEATTARFRFRAASRCLCVTVISCAAHPQAVMAEVGETDVMMNYHGDFIKSDRKNSRYPYCIVWTPIPILS